jgi:hypothetical protein
MEGRRVADFEVVPMGAVVLRRQQVELRQPQVHHIPAQVQRPRHRPGLGRITVRLRERVPGCLLLAFLKMRLAFMATRRHRMVPQSAETACRMKHRDAKCRMAANSVGKHRATYRTVSNAASKGLTSVQVLIGPR